MKTGFRIQKSETRMTVALLAAVSSLLFQLSAFAASTINPRNKFAYGANIGWMDWRGDTGANVVGPVVSDATNVNVNGWANLYQF